MASLNDLPMASLHDLTRSVAHSGASTTVEPAKDRDGALRLMERKKALEDELEAYYDVLKSHESTMTSPLVDREGFPRADIDVASVRTARQRIICLNNDVRDCSEAIAASLPLLLPRPEKTDDTAMDVDAGSDSTEAFALVDGVAPGSPAATAGLQRTDRIVRFGSINASNHDRLRAIAPVLQRFEESVIPVTILRQAEDATEPSTIVLQLTPRKWSGRGLLGCHIVPV